MSRIVPNDEKEDKKKDYKLEDDNKKIYNQSGPGSQKQVWASGIKRWESVVWTTAWSRIAGPGPAPEYYVLQCLIPNSTGQCSFKGKNFQPHGDMHGLLDAWAEHGRTHPVPKSNILLGNAVSTFGKKILFCDDRDPDSWYKEHLKIFEEYHRPGQIVSRSGADDVVEKGPEADGRYGGGKELERSPDAQGDGKGKTCNHQ